MSIAESCESPGSASWEPIPGPIRQYHSMIYDPVRDRLVVFGGSSYVFGTFNDVWALPLSGVPKWSELRPTGARPTARNLQSAIYDPVGDRMIIFGGFSPLGGGQLLNDVWAFSFASLSWTRLLPAGTLPAARNGHSAIFDPVRDRMIVFGGGYDPNQTWALNLSGEPSWSRLPDGPFRGLHSAIYDAKRDRMIIFGGDNDSLVAQNDVWALTFAGAPTWARIDGGSTSYPLPRDGHTAIYDPAQDRMIICDGYETGPQGAQPRTDVWAFSLASETWSPMATAQPPGYAPSEPPCLGPVPTNSRPRPVFVYDAAVYDPVRNRMVLFGGYGYSDAGGLGETWALSLACQTWSELIPSGSPPIGREGHSAIYDPVRRRMIVYGGYYGYFLNSASSFSEDGIWSDLFPPGEVPPARAGHTAIYDPGGDRMVVFGGEQPGPCESCDSHIGNDTWALSLTDPPTWSRLGPPAQVRAPTGRSFHTAIYDPRRGRMLTFGGQDGYSYYNEVWALTLGDSVAWSPVFTQGVPPSARIGHSAIYDPVGDRMIVFGGEDYAGRTNDCWALTLSDPPTWQQLHPAGTLPAPRLCHSAIYDPVEQRMIVNDGNLGGALSTQAQETWSLSLRDPIAWCELNPSTPPHRYDHTAVYDPAGRMIIFGGTHSYFNDTWVLTLDPSATAAVPVGPRAGAIDLEVARPNPARGQARVRLSLPSTARISVGVYGVDGRRVRQLFRGSLGPGERSLSWDGRDDNGRSAPSGVYFVALEGSSFHRSTKLVLLH